jgi:anti-sigma-K factor RskA
MMELDDIDALAAEYVLGTLDAATRTAVAARRQREPALAAAIVAWEARLAPLEAGVTPVAPPPGLKAEVLRQIAAKAASAGSAAGAPPALIVDHKRRAARWRAAALSASALAAAMAGFVAYREILRPPLPRSFVAVLQKDAQSPAFLMTVDVENRAFTVRPVAAERLAGKSYELWLVHEKLGAPKSLGVVGDAAFSISPRLQPYAASDIREATYAVSLEPEGGSPTGSPTGPVLFAGKLFQTKP